MEYKKGERVRHPKIADWGLGQVLANSCDDSVKVFFVGAGEKVLSLKHVQLEHVEYKNAHHPVLDNLHTQKSESKFKYQSLKQLVSCFLTRFPDGFYSEDLKKELHNDTQKAHLQAQKLLNEELLIDCIITADYQQISDNILAVVNASRLIPAAEKKELRETLAKKNAQKKLSLSLYQLLYSKEPLQERFESFSRVLEEFNIAKWTIVSYFLFVTQPKQYLFIKPTVTQHASELCGFEINFKAEINWLTYESMLKFSDYLFTELETLKPRNMNDVQAFISCIIPTKSIKRAKPAKRI
ncbi:hypothetical protein GCM10007916_10290 [Psychromonas marina]|uniref:DUF3553 domain-containing protein n=1 Tax=Psychromonas marina TaxID=88364 RepID=A0ABQ6DXT7_9GAMM|nr:DUF3553 domain-containing protein [Psychromonas marina]GLS89962.1 hypothetical protein GCM10007916_10290 [Psychromonas marina]